LHAPEAIAMAATTAITVDRITEIPPSILQFRKTLASA
jgi:hypothetical protein